MMFRPDLPVRVFLVILLTLAVVLVGYPLAFVLTHGLAPSGWPNGLDPESGMMASSWVAPQTWVSYLLTGNLIGIGKTYVEMVRATAPALHAGGWHWVMGLGAGLCVSATFIVMGAPIVPLRDPTGVHGTARWALPRELAALNEGVEIGLDPNTGRAVRVPIEGNIVTIAPPRTGKTSGLILPNLALPAPRAFSGPVVVIDPKGDVYRAMRARREALGFTVRCIDPLGLVGGSNGWNPLLARRPGDVLYLLSMARSLLPATPHTNDASQFFRDRASAMIAAALLVAINEGHNDPIRAARLIRDEVAFARELKGRTDDLSRDALAVFDSSDDRTRGAILQTAAQAFQWALDPRMKQVAMDHSFDLADLASGQVDLFVVLPADDRREILAPYCRWLLADLFDTVRVNRLAERLLIIIDEAFVLGRFDAILKGVGELPGLGASLWTIWQSRQQMVETYGSAGADVLLDTAEVTTLFNLTRANPGELERWSHALGAYTGYEETTSSESAAGRNSASIRSVAIDLAKPADLVPLTRDHSIAFVSSRTATSYPLKLRKTFAHRDVRFRGLVDPVPPVGPTRSRR